MADIYSTHLKAQKAELTISGDTVGMTTYPRVHMFSLDLSDTSGSLKSGSMGVSLTNFPVEVSVRVVNTYEDIVPKDFAKELLPLLENVRKRLSRSDVYWEVSVDMPTLVGRHTGLGTTTQITGAVSLCAAKTAGVDFSYIDLFNLGIGYASALGLCLLFKPGFIIENGYKVSDLESGGCKMYKDKYDIFQVPVGSVLSLSSVEWHLLLAIPKNAQSLSGKIEDDFWDKILPDSLASTHKITYSMLENVIPSLVTDDYDEFIAGMETATANGTKPMEESIQNQKTKEVLNAIREEYGFAAISSLGPTVYGFSETTPKKRSLEAFTTKYDNFTFHTIKLSELR